MFEDFSYSSFSLIKDMFSDQKRDGKGGFENKGFKNGGCLSVYG